MTNSSESDHHTETHNGIPSVIHLMKILFSKVTFHFRVYEWSCSGHFLHAGKNFSEISHFVCFFYWACNQTENFGEEWTLLPEKEYIC